MLHQQLVEAGYRGVAIRLLYQLHFPQHEGMATDRALAEDHQVAREDVGALHGDGDRCRQPQTAEVVVRAEDDAFAAVDVHGVGDAPAAAFGEVVLEDGREDRGFFAQVHRVGGQDARAVHQPGVAADARQGFLDAFEGRQRHVELLADVRVAAADETADLGGAGTGGRQRDRASDREAVHQHHPAFADHLAPADDGFQRYEDVLAPVRAVHEGRAQGQMTAADFDAGGLGGDQRQADAELLFVTQEMIRVVGLEGDAEQGRYRAEGDIALFPVQAQAEHFFALPQTCADHPAVVHGAGIRAGIGAGEGEAGDVGAVGQARQVMVALFVGAVMHQQFGRAEGVGDHDRAGQIAAAGGELHHDLRMGIGGETLAAVLLGDDQREKALGLDVLPGLWRQVHALADVPFADHGAERLGGAVEECLFFFGELRPGVAEQGVPVRASAEQFAVPPDAAGLDGIALGVGDRWQDLLEPVEHRPAEILDAHIRQQDRDRHHEQHEPEHDHQPDRRSIGCAHERQVDRDDGERRNGRHAVMGDQRDAEQ